MQKPRVNPFFLNLSLTTAEGIVEFRLESRSRRCLLKHRRMKREKREILFFSALPKIRMTFEWSGFRIIQGVTLLYVIEALISCKYIIK